MAVYNYDVVVLGSGPAGEGAAMNAAKAGRKVAVVDNRPLVGGNCTHLGTIPSKALRHSVRQIMQFNTNPMFRQIGEPRWFSFPDVLKSAEKVIAKQVTSRTGYYARNRIDTYFGTASFADDQTVEVVCLNGVVEKLVAKQPNPADARSWIVTLTAAGRQRVKALNTTLDGHAEQLLASLNERDRKEVNRALLVLLKVLRQDSSANCCLPPPEGKERSCR